MSMLFRLRPDSGRSLIIRTARLLICGALLSLSGLTHAADRDPTTLTLSETFARVLSDSPDLAMYPYDIRAAEARALQAGFRPNPQISLDVEDIGGSGEFSGTDAMETTLALSLSDYGNLLKNKAEKTALVDQLSVHCTTMHNWCRKFVGIRTIVSG